MFADDYSIEQAVQDKLDLALFEIEKLSDNQIKEGNKVFGKIRAAKRYGKDPMEYSDNDKQKLMIQYLKVMDKEIKGKLSGAFSGQAISRSAALRSSTREFTGVRHMMSPGMIISGGLTLIKYLVSKRKQKREKYEKYLFRQEMAIQDFMNIIKTID